MSRFTSFDTFDIRFPTSRELDGSDAMNPDPDYSAAYLVLRTDAGDGLEGHGFAFTIGRGNEVQRAAIGALEPYLLGRLVESVLGNLGAFWKELVHDSQLRWLGPEKGVMHMAIGAVVNAVWDLAAKRAQLPLWRFLAQMSPEDIVGLVDFRYLTDALTPMTRSPSYAPPPRAAPSGARTSSPPAIPHMRPRRAGSATTTPSFRASAGRRSPQASLRSSSRWAQASRTTSGG
jgi:L-alanine-DL-glutamate epimerase-like enolase superfamily enzyme